MKKLGSHFFILVFASSILLFMTACGSAGFQVTKAQLESSQQVIQDTNEELDEVISKVEEKTQEVEQLSTDVINDSTIGDAGQLVRPSIFSLNRIKDLLIGGLKPLIEKISVFKDRVDLLKAQIQTQIDALDANDPLQADTIAKLQKLMDKISNVDSKITDVVGILEGRMEVIDELFDKLLREVDGSELWHLPVRIIAFQVKETIKFEISQVIAELLAAQS